MLHILFNAVTLLQKHRFIKKKKQMSPPLTAVFPWTEFGMCSPSQVLDFFRKKEPFILLTGEQMLVR